MVNMPQAVGLKVVRALRQLQARRPYSPHNRFLEGPFAPLPAEHTVTNLVVQGEIPAGLNGVLARIGPNPRHVDNPATYHWFMGDGMVHGLRLENGHARWYRNRYVGSDAVRAERKLPPLPGPRRGLADTVNTNIIGHAGKLWALVEAGAFPVALDGELNSEKVGLFNSPLNRGFTAHPHADPLTGELHAICYDGFEQDRVRYLVITRDGQVRREVRIPVRHGPMMHDCALTASQMVVLDLPVTFSLKEAITGGALPYKWNPRHKARVGLLPRAGEAADMRWFTVDPCFVFHTCNAYDTEEGDVVLDVVVHARMFDGSRLAGPDAHGVTFERWRLRQGHTQVERQVISRETQEFPRLDERRTGRPYRYAYAVGIDIEHPAPNALFCHDLETGTTTRHAYGARWMSGEVVFVPKHATAAENEGWLLSYVHDLDNGPSRVVILDAQKLGAAPQAVIELPVRVPLGFHGNWIADA